MKFSILLAIGLCLSTVYAQKITPSVIANAGAVMKTNSVSLEWTLGEVATETKTGGNLIVTQGFHQANLGITSNQDYSIDGLNVYPNPVINSLNIINQNSLPLEIILHQIDGKEIQSIKSRDANIEFNMQSLPMGTYLLLVRNKNQQQHFTIEKIN